MSSLRVELISITPLLDYLLTSICLGSWNLITLFVTDTQLILNWYWLSIYHTSIRMYQHHITTLPHYTNYCILLHYSLILLLLHWYSIATSLLRYFATSLPHHWTTTLTLRWTLQPFNPVQSSPIQSNPKPSQSYPVTILKSPIPFPSSSSFPPPSPCFPNHSPVLIQHLNLQFIHHQTSKSTQYSHRHFLLPRRSFFDRMKPAATQHCSITA